MVLLLVAQQGALVHAAWHAGKHTNERLDPVTGQASHTPNDSRIATGHGNSDDAQASLCAFDLAFGQMLGGAHGANAPAITAELPTASATYHFVPRCGSDAVPEVSRGPPALL